MKVGEYSSIGKAGAAGRKKTDSAAGSGFMDLLGAGEAESAAMVSPAADISSVSSLDALLSLQEIPDDEITQRKALLQQGSDVVDALDGLRISLLSGHISKNVLERLKNLSVIKKRFMNDQRLSGIISDIELRAAVEIAKLERAKQEG